MQKISRCYPRANCNTIIIYILCWFRGLRLRLVVSVVDGMEILRLGWRWCGAGGRVGRAFRKEREGSDSVESHPLGYSVIPVLRALVRQKYLQIIIHIMIEWYCVICSGPAVVASLVWNGKHMFESYFGRISHHVHLIQAIAWTGRHY